MKESTTAICLVLIAAAAAGAEQPVATTRMLIGDHTAVLGDPGAAVGPEIGILGVCTGSAARSAGAVGEARATSSAVYGVYGRAVSSDAPAGLFENSAVGGKLILGQSTAGPVFVVDQTGGITAGAFVGDGSGVVGGASLTCIGCVDAGDIEDGAITAAHLESSSVDSNAILDGAVTGAKLFVPSVNGTKIADGGVTSAKIADRAVGASQLAAFAVGTAKLADGAVDSNKIAASAVSRNKLDVDVNAFYFQHSACEEPGRLGSRFCFARECAPGLYYRCDDLFCGETVSFQCESTAFGYLLR